MSSQTSTSTAQLRDILRTFWRGMKGRRTALYFLLLETLAGNTLQVITPLYYKRFFDIIGADGSRAERLPQLVKILLVILALNAIVWVMFRVGSYVLNRFESGVIARLKQISFEYLIQHSFSFFSNTFTGSLVQRVNRFARAFERLTDTLIFNFLPLVVNIVGVIIVVYLQKPLMAYILFGWVLVTVLTNYFFSVWKYKYDLRSAAADSATTALLADIIGNQNAVATFAAARREEASFKRTSNEQARFMRISWDLSASMDAVQALFIILLEFFVFYYALKYWASDLITIGTFVLIQVYILGLAGKLWNFSRIVRTVYEGLADSEEMVSILVTPHEITDKENASVLKVMGGAVAFEDVSFGFNADRVVLNKVSLGIKEGEKVAVIGPSGAGKSTLVKLLLRLYDLEEGRIVIDGQDIRDVTQDSLRSAISLVPQDPILFHRTLLENIRYGRPQASDEEVIAAARLAHCDEFIESLPLRYDTFVGERGIKLSGGERQRVAIARAMLKNAPILILDEATSSLDSHSEMLIRDALDVLMKGKTTIVIAHRLSTIRKMDRIIVVKDGNIAEEGTHDELLSQEKSIYKHLWELQAGGFIAE